MYKAAFKKTKGKKKNIFLWRVDIIRDEFWPFDLSDPDNRIWTQGMYYLVNLPGLH